MESVTFAVKGSNSFHKIDLARSLLHFAEFDFTYFWEQSIEAGRNARKTGRISSNIRNLAVNSLVGCHPYVEACIGTEFSAVVTDCIIAYICHSEGIGLEELWARCISPKSLYERDIFNRVSEYKTGRGINQWINIVRMQEYARKKMSFIYETERSGMISSEEYRTRKEYFDLSCAVAANEAGCDMSRMPSVKKYTPANLPDSVFTMGKLSKSIYSRISDVLADASVPDEKNINDHNRDQTALDAFSYVKDMERPGFIEMNTALDYIRQFPDEIYVPDSFKAAIDLEFTCMAEKGIYLSRCPNCGKFFIRDLYEKSPYCNRVNSSGMTCAEQMEADMSLLSSWRGTPEKTEETPAAEPVPEKEEQTAMDVKGTAEEAPAEKAPVQEEIPEKKKYFEIPRNIEKRCQRVYNLLYRRIGVLITPEDFREWARYLTDMKTNLREGNAEIPQIEEFLDYWEDVISRKGRTGRPKREAFDPNPAQKKNTPEENLAELFEEAARQAELKEKEILAEIEESRKAEEKAAAQTGEQDIPKESDPFPVKTEDPSQKPFKPFTPPKYNTVLEAMLDGKYKSDDILGDRVGDMDDDITVRGRKIRLPDWEKIPKE